MKSIRFLFGVVVVFAFICVGYFLLVDNYILYKKEVHKIYPQVLLESLADYKGKVIVIGGSDSHHGIDAQLLEKLMQRPVINFGRNGDYPYPHYIYNLKKYVQPGDIVIAVMGWTYFLRKKGLSNNYVNSLVDAEVTNQFYYDNLPFAEKIIFVFTQLPYRSVIKALLSRPDSRTKVKYQVETAQSMLKRYTENTGIQRGESNRDGPEEVHAAVKEYTCDQYLISRTLKKPLQETYPSDTAIHTIDLLKSLEEEQGVKVFFSWGIAVNKPGDTSCYKSPESDGLNIFVARVKAILDERRIAVLGKYTDYLQPSECFLNTYAHVRKSCASTVTKKLYKNGLNEHTAKDGNIDSESITKQVLNSIRDKENKYINKYYSLTKIDLKKEKIAFTKFSPYVYLGKGWSDIESWGVWSSGSFSKVQLKNYNIKGSSLYMNGHYFNGDEKTQVIINDIDMGSHILKNLKIKLPKKILQSEFLSIKLNHKLVVSPASIGKGSDMRKIKFGLKEIGLK